MSRTILIGLAAASTLIPDWLHRVREEVGCRTIWTPLHQPPPAEHVTLWIIVLRESDPPAALRMWMKQLDGPKLVITPHLEAASLLAERVPQLRIIVHPTRAIAAFTDMVAMAQHGLGAPVALGPVQATSRVLIAPPGGHQYGM